MINVLLPLLLLLLPMETLSGKDDVVIVEPAAMVVKPSADGKWQIVKPSSTSVETSTNGIRPSSTSTPGRKARRGEVELDLFQLGTDNGRNEETEPSKRSSVQLELFEVGNNEEESPKEQERGSVELNLFGDGKGAPKLFLKIYMFNIMR